MKISLVTSLYKSENTVNDYYIRHLSCLKKMDIDYEFIFVNDGSPDDSAAKVKKIIETDNKVKLLDLSRNFGQHAAMFAGLAKASGDYIYATDSDMEEAPENILIFFEEMKKPDVDVVYGTLEQRTGGFVRNLLGKIYYDVLDKISEIKIPRNQAWQRIMTRKYLDYLLQYKEVDSLPIGIMMLVGFNQVPIMIQKPYKGSSTYGFLKRYKLAINSLISYSSKPLVFIGVLGLIITFITFLVSIYIFYLAMFSHNLSVGWPSLILIIFFIGGIQLTSLGVIGLYISKIYDQVKSRPRYVIKSEF